MRFAWLLLAIAFPTLQSAVVAQPRSATTTAQGWRFTYTVTPTVNGATPPGGAMQIDVAIWRGQARITVRQGPLTALTGDSGFLLLRTDDGSLVAVNPARREALRSASGDLSSMLGGPAGTMPLTISGVRSTSGRVTAGPPAFGFPTRQVTLQQAYVLAIALATAQRTLRTEQTIALTLSRGVDALDPAFAAVAEQVVSSMVVPGVVLKALREAQRGLPRGFPVLSVATATTVTGSDTLRSVTRGALTELRRESMDTTSFVVPAGYRITDMSRLLQQPPRRP